MEGPSAGRGPRETIGSVCRPVPLFVFCTPRLGVLSASQVRLDVLLSSPPSSASQKLPSAATASGQDRTARLPAERLLFPSPPPHPHRSPPSLRLQVLYLRGRGPRPTDQGIRQTGALCARLASSWSRLIAAFRDSCSHSKTSLMRGIALCVVSSSSNSDVRGAVSRHRRRRRELH